MIIQKINERGKFPGNIYAKSLENASLQILWKSFARSLPTPLFYYKIIWVSIFEYCSENSEDDNLYEDKNECEGF